MDRGDVLSVAPRQGANGEGHAGIRINLLGQHSARQGVLASPTQKLLHGLQVLCRSGSCRLPLGQPQSTDKPGVAGAIGKVLADLVVVVVLVAGNSTYRAVDP